MQLIIRDLIYRSPLNSDSITPISVLSDNYMKGKRFMIAGGEIDFANEQFTCKMIEA